MEEKNKSSSTNKKTPRKRHGARNQHRHKFLVKWILEKFPDALQCAKDDSGHRGLHRHRHHVLDIAGGKGELSARLTLCHSLFVQMVDPRPANLHECFYKNIYRSLPKKWQEKIRNDQIDNPNKIQSILDARFHQFVTSFPCDGGGLVVLDDRKEEKYDEKNGGKTSAAACSAAVIQLQKDAELLQAVENCTLMIGMHADGATEAIVDIALYYRKPFVVVPCCVFPNLFQNRMVEHDQTNQRKEMSMIPVRTHEQFCQYLALKDSHFVMETLPFEGRNIGIWWDGIHRDGDGDGNGVGNGDGNDNNNKNGAS